MSQLLVDDAIGVSNLSAEQLGFARRALETAVDQFEATHVALSTGEETRPSVRSLYFATADNQTSLDDLVTRYVLSARGILADPNDVQNLADLQSIERAGLLSRLDSIVQSVEAQSLAAVDQLRFLGRAALVVALLIVMAEIVFVFLPGHRMI